MENNEFAAIETVDGASMMPEGGLSEEDIIDAPEFTDDSFEKFFESYANQEQPDDTTGEEETPTTENPSPAAEEEESDASPTTEKAEGQASNKIKVRVKVDHNEQDIDIDQEDLPGIWQRANNYDRLHKKFSEQEEKVQGLTSLAKQLGFESIEAMVEHAAKNDRDAKVQALVDEGTSRDIAEDYIDRKLAKARDAEKPMATETQQKTEEKVDYKAQVEELFRVRPDLKGKLSKLPAEVVKAVVEENLPLRTAYAEWEARQAKAEQDRLRKDNERFAQTAEAASRAPVRGTNNSHTDKGDKVDPFEKGFREYKW